ncbi:response regulator transcription factor [Phenylobacterium sp. VNQ135]|uniref:response regulator transcription factor n=1 Tax=Phenylobacterium sp. VNQ135 TaxID=3400922 RepID=UPI003BFD4AFA
MAPLLQRVLIVDPQPASATLIGEAMRNIARSQSWIATTPERGLKLCETVDPQIVFVELALAKMSGVEFTKKLRRSQIAARQVPVIMMTGAATAAGILAARDAGVHEVLRRPFTMKDLLRRLEAVTLRQRDWIEAVGYVGPDRRRFNSGDYTGPLKRRSDNRSTPDAARLAQALKILRSAVSSFDSDPAQAARSIEAQVQAIQKAATAAADLKLTTAAAELARYIVTSRKMGVALNQADVSKHAAALLAYMPKDDAAAA